MKKRKLGKIKIGRLPKPKIRGASASEIREIWRTSGWGFPDSLIKNNWISNRSFS